MSKSNLGEFEQMVLLATLQLEENAYAVTIRQKLEEAVERSVARGALYTTLERLEAKGYLASKMSVPIPERGGRSRRYYRVVAEGARALRSSRDAMLKLWQGAQSLLEKAP